MPAGRAPDDLALELDVDLRDGSIVVDAEDVHALEVDEVEVHGGRVRDHGGSRSVGLDTEQNCRALVSHLRTTSSSVQCVASVPDLDLHKIRKYAAEKVPMQHWDQIRMEVDVRGKTVTIVECRPPWHEMIGPEWTRLGVARMKYSSDTNEWTLYWSDRNSRWHIFDLIDPGPIDEILKEIELDQTCIFWG